MAGSRVGLEAVVPTPVLRLAGTCSCLKCRSPLCSCRYPVLSPPWSLCVFPRLFSSAPALGSPTCWGPARRSPVRSLLPPGFLLRAELPILTPGTPTQDPGEAPTVWE